MTLIIPQIAQCARALRTSASLLALVAAGATQAQTQISGEGFSIEIFEEPTREEIYGEELSYADPAWFYLGIVDLTFGRRSITSPHLVSQDGAYQQGRSAAYVNGPLTQRWELTAAVDTTQEDLDEMFSSIGQKTPQEMLQRLDDPERYYPVYGDDSTFEETAPTIGRFYIRVEDDRNHAMWGTFKSTINGTEYLRNERTLYGAQAVFNSAQQMPDGRARQHAEIFAASPETFTQRDVFLGTGGSSYFLKERDLSIGSETLQIETRDAVTGAVLSRRTLNYGTDYRVNYAQGLVILNDPLGSTAGDSGVVSQGTSGDKAYLVATYEYEPVATDVDAYAFGGRYEIVATERLRFGISAQEQQTNGADQSAIGLDAEYRLSDASYLRAEYARTDGPGDGFSLSTDGGQIINDSGTLTGTGRALRVEFAADLAEMGFAAGSATGYFEDRTAGFSTLTTQTSSDETLWGLDVEAPLSPTTRARLFADSFENDTGKSSLEVGAEITYALGETLDLEVGASHLDKTEPGNGAETGSRTNIGARLTRTFSAADSAYLFAEGTLARSGGLSYENRLGIGGTRQISQRLAASGEISGGSGGLGAKARLDYQESADNRYYLGYVLDPKRSLDGVTLNGDDDGRFVLGGARRINDRVNVFAENTYDMFGAHRALTSAYGIDFAVSEYANYTVAVEVGEVDDATAGNFDRTAISFGGLFKNDAGFSLNSRIELRQERGQNRDADSALLSFAASQEFDEHRRALASLDAVLTDPAGASVPLSEYIEATIGYAVRPADSDRINALFKYTFLHDDRDQTINGTASTEPAQRSHIISADADYAYNERWTVGGKVGVRLSQSNSGSGWVENNAGLVVANVRYAINDRWDVVGEARSLWNFSRNTQDTGVLIAAYRHIGNNVMIGAGYNFGTFSDDLSDLSFNNRGAFLNIIAKF